MEEVIETWVYRRFYRISATLCHQVRCFFTPAFVAVLML